MLGASSPPAVALSGLLLQAGQCGAAREVDLAWPEQRLPQEPDKTERARVYGAPQTTGIPGSLPTQVSRQLPAIPVFCSMPHLISQSVSEAGSSTFGNGH